MENKKNIGFKDYYNKKALEFNEIKGTYLNKNSYKKFFYGNRFSNVFTALSPKKGEKILDIGAGSGYYSFHALRKGALVTASDISQNYLSQAKKLCKGKIETVVASSEKLPFKDNIFDKILMSEVIEHTPKYRESVKEAIRVLKPGGIAVITTPNKKSYMNYFYKIKKSKKKYTFDEHVVEFDLATFKNLLRKYSTIQSISFSTYLLPYPLDSLAYKADSKNLTKILFYTEKILSKIPIISRLGWTMIATIKKE